VGDDLIISHFFVWRWKTAKILFSSRSRRLQPRTGNYTSPIPHP